MNLPTPLENTALTVLLCAGAASAAHSARGLETESSAVPGLGNLESKSAEELRQLQTAIRAELESRAVIKAIPWGNFHTCICFRSDEIIVLQNSKQIRQRGIKRADTYIR